MFVAPANRQDGSASAGSSQLGSSRAGGKSTVGQGVYFRTGQTELLQLVLVGGYGLAEAGQVSVTQCFQAGVQTIIDGVEDGLHPVPILFSWIMSRVWRGTPVRPISNGGIETSS